MTMLPAYLETKRLFSRFFQSYVRERARAISPFAAVQVQYLHEGRAMKIRRPDLTESASEVKAVSAEMQVRFDEIPDLTIEQVLAKFNAVVVEMSGKQAGVALDRISEEIPPAQTVDAKGRKLDAEMVLEMLGKIELEFYPDGRPHELHPVGGQFSPERLAAIEAEFQASPPLQKRYKQLIEKKRDEWRAREADRKLVG